MTSELEMERMLTDVQLTQLSEFVAARLGLYFPQERWRELERAAARCAKDLGYEDARACVQRFVSRPVSRGQIAILATHLSVGETYFFRDTPSFESLARCVLPELIALRRATGRRLRIWSAGCSTGEEPYSVAMLLARLLPDLDDWNISILATDINPHALQKASNGVYNDWSFRGAPPEFKAAFFMRAGHNGFQLAPRIKALVTFAWLNLVEDPYPWAGNQTDALDLILCRNVLMYFEPTRIQQVLGRLSLCMVDGGWLFVSPVDAPHACVPQLTAVTFAGALAYRNDVTSRSAQPTAPALASLPSADSSCLPLYCADPDAAEKRPAGVSPALRYEARGAQASIWSAQERHARLAVAIEERSAQQSADADAMGLLATTDADQGRLADAAQWCEKASRADRLNPRWCYLLGTILHEQGRIKEAVTALKRALYLDQSDALTHFALGNLTRKQGKLTEAAQHVRNALSVLSEYHPEHVLPGSEGITAGRLAEIIASTV